MVLGLSLKTTLFLSLAALFPPVKLVGEVPREAALFKDSITVYCPALEGGDIIDIGVIGIAPATMLLFKILIWRRPLFDLLLRFYYSKKSYLTAAVFILSGLYLSFSVLPLMILPIISQFVLIFNFITSYGFLLISKIT